MTLLDNSGRVVFEFHEVEPFTLSHSVHPRPRRGQQGPPYTPCKLFYDGERLSSGDYLKTPAGSAYLVERVKITLTGRQYLDCVRWPAAEIPEGARVFPLYWYPRNRRRGRTLASLDPYGRRR